MEPHKDFHWVDEEVGAGLVGSSEGEGKVLLQGGALMKVVEVGKD